MQEQLDERPISNHLFAKAKRKNRNSTKSNRFCFRFVFFDRFAELTIVLANEGTEAYKSAIYGNEIRIVRRIGLRHSSYRIMDINHKFLSASKETIDEILQALSIMPENPLCILHQEIAKKFLLNNDSRTKYHFYMKVSQLDQIKQAYEQSLCTVHYFSNV